MILLHKLNYWRFPSILLLGIGISNIGEWIYLLALNLIVLEMTNSPLAVSGLYIMKPIGAFLANIWAGSLIDRLNKRKLMMILDMIRAILISLLPFMSSLVFICVFVLFINMASSMFGPTSMSYMTKLIPRESRKQFNSIRCLVTSGAFFIGPAIAGILFLIGTPKIAIFLNAIAYAVSGIITLLLPDIEKDSIYKISSEKLSIRLIKKDWSEVAKFSEKNKNVLFIYLLFTGVMTVMASATDSLEAAFAQEELRLSESEYSFLVSVAGAGILTGAGMNALIVKNIKTNYLIGFGAITVSTGYIIYAFSHSFTGAALGFFVLAFFIAFANTGFLTFCQNNIPVEIMGRVSSVYNFINESFIIIATSLMGAAAQFTSIRLTVIIGVIIMMVLSVILLFLCLKTVKNRL